MPFTNPEAEEIKALLQRVNSIAVVGFSPKPGRPSHNIGRRMQGFGFRIIPVRPGISEGLGEKAYPDLASVPEPIDLVNVFRSGKYIPEVVDQCLRLGINNIWMQEGAEHEASAERARSAGMTVVMGRCIMRDYARLCLG
ncbi:MAG: CoA-binding protein [Betaproteobacteria bacterium]|nr:CoA-binding protein [Betaproteobacteria bacterium]